MAKFRHVITLLVILISLILIDEGRVIMLIGDNIKIHLNHAQNKEIEIPSQYSFNRTDDDVTWISSNSAELSCPSAELLVFSCCSNRRTVDYAGFVWQPPESV